MCPDRWGALEEIVTDNSGPFINTVMIVVDTPSEVNPKETKAQLTTTAGALNMRGFN